MILHWTTTRRANLQRREQHQRRIDELRRLLDQDVRAKARRESNSRLRERLAGLSTEQLAELIDLTPDFIRRQCRETVSRPEGISSASSLVCLSLLSALDRQSAKNE
jgi:hypothetical protein